MDTQTVQDENISAEDWDMEDANGPESESDMIERLAKNIAAADLRKTKIMIMGARFL
ncbi:MAG: hypothetical protein K2O18_10340 [Oscillospiraceae bacterium]|nr:hypothetical protein [Oscillospiraceae bacterium]